MKDKLKKMLKDDLARDILTFFYENQACMDSASGVSAWVHSDRKTVRELLLKFVDLGVLELDSTGKTKGYCYTRKKSVMKVVEGLMENA